MEGKRSIDYLTASERERSDQYSKNWSRARAALQPPPAKPILVEKGDKMRDDLEKGLVNPPLREETEIDNYDNSEDGDGLSHSHEEMVARMSAKERQRAEDQALHGTHRRKEIQEMCAEFETNRLAKIATDPYNVAKSSYENQAWRDEAEAELARR